MWDFKNTSYTLDCFVLCCGSLCIRMHVPIPSSTEVRGQHQMFFSIILRLIPLTRDLSLSLGLAISARLASQCTSYLH